MEVGSAVTKTDRLIVFGGGYPIQMKEVMIGGIGVSERHYTMIWRSLKLPSSEQPRAGARPASTVLQQTVVDKDQGNSTHYRGRAARQSPLRAAAGRDSLWAAPGSLS